jgi:hypothetical protein
LGEPLVTSIRLDHADCVLRQFPQVNIVVAVDADPVGDGFGAVALSDSEHYENPTNRILPFYSGRTPASP